MITFTYNKGKNAANYFKEKHVTDEGGKWLNWLHSILGRFSTDFRNSQGGVGRGDYRNYYKGHFDKIKGEGGGGGMEVGLAGVG